MTKPSGSFVLWDNTMCNPLAPAREQARSAWEDGYASGVAAEREESERLRELCYELRSELYAHGASEHLNKVTDHIRTKGLT